MNYYVARDGQQYGPYTGEIVKHYLWAGSLFASDYIREESSAWIPIGQLVKDGAYFYIARNGQQYGPYTEETVTSYLEADLLSVTDHIREESSSQWITIGQLMGVEPKPNYASKGLLTVALLIILGIFHFLGTIFDALKPTEESMRQNRIRSAANDVARAKKSAIYALSPQAYREAQVKAVEAEAEYRKVKA